jgi:hypothetical protein
MSKSRSLPSLGKPGGPGLFGVKGEHLPVAISDMAKHLHHDKGHDKGTAIAIAVSQAKRICSTGRSNFGQVSPEKRAKYCKAVAEWEAKKAKAHAIPNKK